MSVYSSITSLETLKLYHLFIRLSVSIYKNILNGKLPFLHYYVCDQPNSKHSSGQNETLNTKHSTQTLEKYLS